MNHLNIFSTYCLSFFTSLTKISKTSLLKNYSRIFLLGILSFGYVQLTIAQITKPIFFKKLGTEEDFPKSVISVLKDKKGFLWINTKNGMYQYDGISFEQIKNNTKDSLSPKMNSYRNLSIGKSDTLWAVSHANEVCFYDASTEQLRRIPIILAPDDKAPGSPIISSISEDSRGLVWVTTVNDHGINLLNPATGQLSQKEVYKFLPDHFKNVARVFEDSKGNIWGIGDNLFCLSFKKDSKEIKSITHYEELVGNPVLGPNPVRYLDEDEEGNIWIAGFEGKLFKINPETETVNTFNDYKKTTFQGAEKRAATVNGLVVSNDGKIWMANRSAGVSIFNPTTTKFKTYRQNEFDPLSLGSDNLNHIYKDEKGTLWISTFDDGLNFYHPKMANFGHFRSIPNESTALSNNTVLTFFEDSKQNIWIGTNNSLNKFNRQTGTFQQYYLPSSISNNKNTILSCITEYNASPSLFNNNLLIGSSKGLLLFNRESGKFTKWKAPDAASLPMEKNHVLNFSKDKSGNIWANTYFPNQIFRLDQDAKTFRLMYSVIEEERFVQWFIIPDNSENYLLYAPEKGLSKLDLKTQKKIDLIIQPSDVGDFECSHLYTVFKDKKERYWLGGAGLFLLTPVPNKTNEYTFRNLTDHLGLYGELVYGILEDEEDQIWGSTSQGILKINPDNLKVDKFGKSHGLQGVEFNNQACYLSPSKKDLYFGGKNGFNVFNPKEIKKDTVPPSVVITELGIFRDSSMQNFIIENLKNEKGEISIEMIHGDKLLQINYTALDLTDPKGNQYIVQMEGYDENWRQMNKKSSVTYTNLDPGDYLFKIKAANKDGIWNEESTSIKVIVHPPWWTTWWAYLSYAILFGTGLYFLNRFQLKRHAEKQESSRLKELDQLKSRFFINVAHELRTPLTLISGPLQNILKRDDASPRTLTDLMLMKNHTKRLLDLVGEILDLSKMEKGKLQLKETTVDFYSLLRQLVSAFESAANYDNIILKFNYKLEQPLHLELDISKFEKIINNLLSNALKFTPKNGQISLTASDLGANIQIEVEDTGKGIPPEDLPHIFDRYFQTKKTNEPLEGGTGIGLALCKEYARLFGGDIRVESTLGEGSTFILVFAKKEIMGLPFEAQKTDVTQHQKIKTEFPTNTSIKENAEKMKILVVEDNSDMRFYIKRILKENFDCTTAQNGQVAWEMLSENTVQPDLIISDVMMPYMDGFTLLEKIKEADKWRGTPVIMLTARAAREDRLRGLTYGIDDYIIKPFDGEELLVRITNLLENYKTRQTPIIQNPKEIEALNPEKMQFETVTSADLQWMEEIAEHIKSDLDNPELSLLTVAQKMAISERHLRRRIKQITGMNAGNYLKEIRLQRARQLLEDKAFQSISEVSYAVGFNTPKYFTKIFKARFGKLPSEYA